MSVWVQESIAAAGMLLFVASALILAVAGDALLA
jgi:hypothetical protein